MKKLSLIVLCLALMLGTAGLAGAYTINDLTASQAGVTITSSGTIISRTWQGYTGYGVQGGNVSGEIDGVGTGEWVLVAFDTPQYIDSVQISALYTSGNYGDVVDETALFSYDTDYANRPVSANAFITADTATTAVTGGTDGIGGWSNVSPGEDGSGGVWLMTDLFNGKAVSSILFYVNSPASSASLSDFSIMSIETSSVPIPAAVWLLGSGLLGLVGLRRRRRS